MEKKQLYFFFWQIVFQQQQQQQQQAQQQAQQQQTQQQQQTSQVQQQGHRANSPGNGSANKGSSPAAPTNSSSPANLVAATSNKPQTESKPVECNLCSRTFKNIPALNGHMRLHGGYFKKVSDFYQNFSRDCGDQLFIRFVVVSFPMGKKKKPLKTARKE